VFGLNEALMSFIRRQVGLRTDAASSTGSLHAKVTEIRNYLAGTVYTNVYNNLVQFNPKSLLNVIGYAPGYSSEETETVVINLTGKIGYLYAVNIYSNHNTTLQTTLTVTIDGVTMDIFKRAIAQSEYQTRIHIPIGMHFLSSCKVAVKVRTGSGASSAALYVNAMYYSN